MGAVVAVSLFDRYTNPQPNPFGTKDLTSQLLTGTCGIRRDTFATGKIFCSVSCRLIFLVAVAALVSPFAAIAQGPTSSDDLQSMVEAVTHKGCVEDNDYRSVAGVPCSDLLNAGGGDPDAVLQTLGESSRTRIDALTVQARKEDSACSMEVQKGAVGGTSVGPSADQFAAAIKQSAIEDAKNLTLPVGLMLSIPGYTQVQYDYKGLSNGPEVRTFKITGHVDGDVDSAKLHLKMDGDVDGDKNLYVEYTVNYQKTKSPFPAWSPFLDGGGDISRTFVRDVLNTLSAKASFSEKGQHRNNVQVWHDYEYDWQAEKVGAHPKDVVKQNGGDISDISSTPFGGDWVGTAWGSETRFEQTQRQFVGQFSPALAGTMKPEEGTGVIMSLNVKHESVFYFHIDYDGNVTGRGTITYTLDPNLCGVAVLTRQVNQQVNLMKYLPMVFQAAQWLGDLAVTRFEAQAVTYPQQITQKVDEFIKTLPPKVEPSIGIGEVEKFLAAHPEIQAGGRVRNLAFADVDVAGFPKGRLWRPSGSASYPNIPEIVPTPTESKFVTGKWSQEFKLDESGWNAVPTGKEPFYRGGDSERVLMEYLAKVLPQNAAGTIKIYSRFPVCPKCTGVIEQFYWKFPKVTLLVTSGN
ncbi:MAG: deaminase domain-containing protein [Terracidiphilus sp.]